MPLLRTEMVRGVVKSFDAQKGYGFIVPEGKVGIAERDIFVHISDVQKPGLTTVSAGQVIEYQLYENHRGRSHAQNLKVIRAEPG
jgi:cold shock protein